MTRSGTLRRWLGAFAAIALLATAGCGGAPSAGSAVELRVLTPIFEGPTGKQLLEKALLPKFVAQHPGVTVKVDYASYTTLNEKLSSSLASGMVPDVIMMGVGWIEPFAAKGVIAQLPDELAHKQDFAPEVLRAARYGGRLYALPIMLDTRFVVYRKDMFAAAGITNPPQTFEELRQDAIRLTRRAPDGALQVAGFDPFSQDLRQVWETFLFANGGRLFSEDGTKVLFNSPEGVGALDLLTRLVRNDKVVDVGFSKPGTDVVPPLVQGRAAMMLGHNNVWRQLEQNAPDLIRDDKVGAFLLRNTEPVLFQGGTLVTMSARTRHKDAARALVEYLTSPEVSLLASQQRGNVPTIKSLLDSDYARKDRLVQFALENMDKARQEGGVKGWLQIRGKFQSALEAAVLGRKTPKQALDDLAADAQRAL